MAVSIQIGRAFSVSYQPLVKFFSIDNIDKLNLKAKAEKRNLSNWINLDMPGLISHTKHIVGGITQF